MVAKLAPYVIKLAAVLAILFAVGYAGYMAGASKTAAMVQAEVIANHEKADRIRKEIQRNSPAIGADRRANLVWLRAEAVR
jgi:hypothetical protein